MSFHGSPGLRCWYFWGWNGPKSHGEGLRCYLCASKGPWSSDVCFLVKWPSASGASFVSINKPQWIAVECGWLHWYFVLGWRLYSDVIVLNSLDTVISFHEVKAVEMNQHCYANSSRRKKKTIQKKSWRAKEAEAQIDKKMKKKEQFSLANAQTWFFERREQWRGVAGILSQLFLGKRIAPWRIRVKNRKKTWMMLLERKIEWQSKIVW